MNAVKRMMFILSLLAVLMFSVSALAAEDVSWYDASKTEFEISTADQLRGLSKLSADGTLKSGITIKLTKDIDLKNENFEPINEFSGVFDGQGHTIKNLLMDHHGLETHNYISLFRTVTDTTIKNIKFVNVQVIPDGCGQPEHNAYSSTPSYFAEAAIVAGMSYGDCLFENITIKDSYASAYNNSVGGVLAEAYDDVVFKNIHIDESNELEAFWGTHDGRVGGVLGLLKSGVSATFVDCYIAPVLDVFNDVMGNYQYYKYRYAGMLVGEAEDNQTNNNAKIFAQNTTIGFGPWSQYYYCEFESNGKPSYAQPGEWKFSRVDPNDPDVLNHVHDDDESHLVLLGFENLYGADYYPYTPVTLDNVETRAPGLMDGLKIIWVEPAADPIDPDNNNDVQVNLPQTGDNSHLLFFAALLALSGAGLMVCRRRSER